MFSIENFVILGLMVNRFKFHKILSGIILILSITIWYSESYVKFLTPQPNLSVSFLDVGQGDAIYIRAPNGNDVLIDGGPNDSVIQQLHMVIPPFDQDIDLMVATHPDKDHIAGLVEVLEEYQVGMFLHSEISSGTTFDTSLKEHILQEPGVQQIIARRGQRIILDPTKGIYLDILYPDHDTTNFKETNEASIVTRLVYGTQSFLLTGDSPSTIEQFIISHSSNNLKSTVLKLGHHGSKTSSSNIFLEAVQPEYAVVSAGKNNRYHHPAPETIARVSDHTIPILSTIDKGTITFETDGKTLWIK